MAVLTLPTTPQFQTATFRLVSNTQTFRSPFDGAVQTLERAGSVWAGNYSLAPMERADAAPWQAVLAQLRGQANRFYAGDPFGATPRGVATGTPQVDGASQTGGTLNTKGWTANITGILLRGDYLAFPNGAGRRELHMVVADANSDAGGLAPLTIEPPIRSSPADSANLIISNATCEMAMVNLEQVQWGEQEGGFLTLGFQAVEILT